MISIPVQYNHNKAYDIVLDDGVPFESTLSHVLLTAVSDAARRCVVLVTDDTVEPLYAEEAERTLAQVFSRVERFVFPAGEQHKTLEEIRRLYAFLVAHHVDRHDVLCALGGGVVGDMCGFAAATYLRGIRFVQMPTTLLSQTDASIGGKCGVDFDGYKNMVGAFHMPQLVYIHPEVLRTLPEDEFYSGMAEVIKHGLIRDAAYVDMLEREREDVLARDCDRMTSLLQTGCIIKRDIVERDPTEKGERALLNFGHTIGHAIEKAYEFRLTHGACVALGSVAAADLSLRRGMIDESAFRRIVSLFSEYHLPVMRSDLPDTDTILAHIKSDKKMDAGQIRFILLKRIGEAEIVTDVTDEEMRRVIDALRGERHG